MLREEEGMKVIFFNGKSAMPMPVELTFDESGLVLTFADHSKINWNINYITIDMNAENFCKIHENKNASAYLMFTEPSLIKEFVVQYNLHSKRKSFEIDSQDSVAFRTLKYSSMFVLVVFVISIFANYSAPMISKFVPKTLELKIFNPFIEQMTKNKCDAVVLNEKIKKYGSWISGDPNAEIVISSSEDINAFAVPGGKMVVFYGLIKNSDSPDELIGVLAHEVGHVEKKHVTQLLVRQFFMMGWLVGMYGGVGQQFGFTSSIVPIILANLHSKKYEIEADEFAIEKLDAMGLNRNAFSHFFEKMIDEKNQRKTASLGEGVEKIISNHPLDRERIELIQNSPRVEKTNYLLNESQISEINEDRKNWSKIKSFCFEFSKSGGAS